MVYQFRLCLARRLLPLLHDVSPDSSGALSAHALSSRLRWLPSAKGPTLALSPTAPLSLDCLRRLERVLARCSGSESLDWLRLCRWDADGAFLILGLTPTRFASDIVNSVIETGETGTLCQPREPPSAERVTVVDFSSPNIAKPLHVGHLRSTILGGAISNLLESSGEARVVRLNYLGDWGTQLGAVSAAVHAESGGAIPSDLSDSERLHWLNTLYARYSSSIGENPGFLEEARRRSRLLESGDVQEERLWRECRRLSLSQLSSVYDQLGVKFDAWHSESMYRTEQCRATLQALCQTGAASVVEGATELGEGGVLSRSDGTCTYLLRDVAAAVDRVSHWGADRLVYVVDSAQSRHFEQLGRAVSALEPRISLEHVSFGRVRGMGSRKLSGSVGLQELVDKASELRRKRRQDASTSRQTENPLVDRRLAVSALRLHELSQRRCRDYTFSWQMALSSRSTSSGVRLQYSHCRLSSLQERFHDQFPPPSALLGHLLSEPEAMTLLQMLPGLEVAVSLAAERREPCVLTSYLAQLCSAQNAAISRLNVLKSPPPLRDTRFLMFKASRLILAEGLRILGDTPLTSM